MKLALLSDPGEPASCSPSSRTGVVFATEWPDEVMDLLRQRGDHDWDHLWGIVDRQTFAGLLSLDLRNDEPLPPRLPGAATDLPPEVVRFFSATGQLPIWAEPERIHNAQHLFSKHGLNIAAALLCASLPECYAAVKGASIIHLGTNLKDRPEKRIPATTQFVLDVMQPGGLEPEGRGLRRIQQVRLLHVAVRHGLSLAREYRPEWDLPLNQEDLLGTLMSFSSVVMDMLPKLGVDLTQEEEEDYLHAWQVIGHILGVDAEQLPASPKAARHLAQRIRDRHFAKEPGDNPAGTALAGMLVRYLQDLMPGERFDGYVPALIRYLIGDPLADLLSIPRDNWTRVFLGVGRAMSRVTDLLGDRNWACRIAAEWFGRRVLELAHTLNSDGTPQHFSVSATIARSLRLRPRSVARARSPAASARRAEVQAH